ncbi:carbon starvation CstA family protein [Nocardia ninae]|uniref:Carbon starvation protein A n=1 Tax=Nocardia ninae NBRC 108245 TaxID=1210091 RepID=A0A511MUN7_9NOCA|nr:carbon starvation CstA family protein [Nocardia ninae]GEM43857.1 carbon starvation protein A [Nocardia ninae NBRC 108245]
MATIEYLRTDPDLPPVGVVDRSPITPVKKGIFAGIAIIGAIAWAIIAIARGESVNAVWIVVAAVSTYVLAYQFYSRLIEYKIVKPRDDQATPAEILENGKDYMPMDRRVLFGHHFAAIAGAGPLVGPVLAAQMGYLPGTIWIVIGVVFAGAVQDYLVLWASTRRRGRSLGQMARDELGAVGGVAAIIAVLVIMMILLAVLGIVVVNALAATPGPDGVLHGGSPWGVFSIAMTIPIALFMGVYLRFLRPGAVGEVSLIGFALLMLAIISGNWVAGSGWGQDWFTLSGTTIAWGLILYGFIASVLPVWLLLAPRDYLSTFMKIGTIVLLAVGVLITMPVLKAPAVSEFAFSGNGPSFAGSLFPFLFITIACGALSGFHALVSSGTTPKLLEKQSHARMIGYGGMLMESFVAVMAIITASIIDQHLYFAMNASAGLTGGTAEKAAAYTNSLGLAGDPITAADLNKAASDVGETSIVSRTGGAPTLAVGMSEVLHRFLGGTGLKAFWYHFAIMFEALFILTTIDAGTRVARFMLSDSLGNFGGPARKFKDPSWRPGAWLCSAIVVAAWGSVLLMGVTDPLGGIYTLYPLFGISNQLLAAIALTVVLTIVIKKGLIKWAWIPAVPLFWDLTVTMTASWQKIFSADPKIGYWKQHSNYSNALDAGKILAPAKTVEDMEKVVRNTFIQGTLSIIFAVLVLVVAIVGVLVCVRAWRAGGGPSSESEDEPSKIFAPKAFFATSAEKEVQREWDALIESGKVRAPGAAHAKATH